VPASRVRGVATATLMRRCQERSGEQIRRIDFSTTGP
jgi:hypothetical protein